MFDTDQEAQTGSEETEAGRQMFPATVDGCEPGMMLAAFLSRVDLDRLTGHDRVVALRAYQRMASYYQAQVLAAMAAVAGTMNELFGDDPALEYQAASTEIRTALTMTRRAAEADLGLALGVRDRLPRVWELLVAGKIDLRRARVLVDGTIHLDVEAAREVVDRVAEQAPRLTTGRLRARLQRLCVDARPGEAALRHEQAVEQRRVVVEASPDGTAHLLGLDLEPDRAMAASQRIDGLARRLSRRGETRTIDQLRADVLMDLLEGTGRHTSGRGVVELRVDAATLAGLTEASGDLGGYGPVISEIARRVASRATDAEWRYVVTDRGGAVHTGTIRRRPSAAQRRMVEARYPTCVFPGCRVPAAACDLDHRIPWAEGGPTHGRNLAPCCRHDHVARHRLGWRYRRLASGDHQWTSPLGHTYTTSGLPP